MTIVIMVTVLAGVLPLVSPNNNSRKVREAARQLSSMLSQAQAQAARDGRSVGVAFTEFDVRQAIGPYSGMALEAYFIAEPPAYAGFSENSRALVEPAGLTYGTTGPSPNQGTIFSARYEGKPVCQIQFLLSPTRDDDPFPPRMLRIGDAIEAAGNQFLICDDADPAQMPNQVERIGDIEYLLSDPTKPAPTPGVVLHAIWTNYVPGRKLPRSVDGQPYRIGRRPLNSSGAPLQFPRGIGIDLQASGAEGFNVPGTFDQTGVNTVGVMFSPNGSIDALYYDGVRREGVDQVYLLTGLFENGNDGSQDSSDYDFAGNPSADDADMAGRRGRINWLSADSRWVTVNRAGRVITSENNTSFDPSNPNFHNNGTTGEQQAKQIDFARLYAREMTGSSGR